MIRHLLAGVLVIAAASGAWCAQDWRISNWRVDGRLDVQGMYMDDPEMSTTRGRLMAAELETTATISNAQRDILDLAIQWPYATDMNGVDGRGKEMHFANVYALYKFGLGKPSLRFGQFVVPFGNLTYYETHTRPLQSLFPQSLGIRIDRGLSLEGYKGEYDYWLALMGGNGARSDNNDSPIVVGRLARRFDLPKGVLTAGASVLYGADMPRFSTLVDPVMGHGAEPDTGGHMPALEITDKLRIALDAEYSAGPDLWRAELVVGPDADGGTNGQFVQWNRMLNERQELTVQAARWEQPGGDRLRLGGSVGHMLDDRSTARLSVERSLGRTIAERRNETMISLQLLREFPDLFGK